MHAFTSVTANYIPKARVLARSLKKLHPEARFHLVLSDARPDWLGEADEPFDSVIQADELPIADFRPWVFKHSVVELCTAVKGLAFLEILRRHPGEKAFYLDPDIVVLGRLDPILDALDRHSVLVTPHLTEPETTREGILDNEISCLKHGVFNLGFLAVRDGAEGRRFLQWWADRLAEFCYDDIAGGLFTDQRWVDLAPCFFEDLRIWREPGCNVATWNLSHRVVTGSWEEGFLANGMPLRFYHFSGFDSGAQEAMLGKYGARSPVLRELRRWYIGQCGAMGQEAHGKAPCRYAFFDDGQPVTRAQRVLYRARPDLQARFADPYASAPADGTYQDWYRANVGEDDPSGAVYAQAPAAVLLSELMAARNELALIRNSRSWRLARGIAAVARALRRRRA